MEANKRERLAVLIDADNPSATIAEALFAEIARYGTATVRRAYGDWTTQNLVGWKATLHKLAIQPIQQFAYTSKKNSTDSALIIDAMDLLYTGNFDGFCIVSSDSDFTRLATRLRESGLVVYGFGEEKTPAAFRAACDKFVYTSILKTDEEGKTLPIETAPEAPTLKSALNNAIEATARDDGWAHLGSIGAILLKSDPSFDPRNFGHKKLGELVRAQPYLEIREQKSGNELAPTLLVRLKARN